MTTRALEAACLRLITTASATSAIDVIGHSGELGPVITGVSGNGDPIPLRGLLAPEPGPAPIWEAAGKRGGGGETWLVVFQMRKPETTPSSGSVVT